MKFELLIFGVTAFFITNVYHDGKYVKIMKSWKKYYQMIGIGFVGLSAYVFIRKYPQHSRSLFTHANGIIKYMPIDKDASDLLTPIFDMSKANIFSGYTADNTVDNNNSNNSNNSNNFNNNFQQITPHQKRMMNSGKNNNTKRCVSETKKKFVAAQQGWNCGACKQQLPAWFEVDHKIRLDNGGSNHVDNLVALCRDCHGKKTAFENL
jgi:hypothetical protein